MGERAEGSQQRFTNAWFFKNSQNQFGGLNKISDHNSMILWIFLRRPKTQLALSHKNHL
jgi:hypothetical protein